MEKYIHVNLENVPGEMRSKSIDGESTVEIINWLEEEYEGYEFCQAVASAPHIRGFFIMKRIEVAERPPMVVCYMPTGARTMAKVKEMLYQVNQYIDKKIPKGWVFFVFPDRERMNMHIEHINPDHMSGEDYEKFKVELEALNNQVKKQFESE